MALIHVGCKLMRKMSRLAVVLAFLPLLGAGEPVVICSTSSYEPTKEGLSPGCRWEYDYGDAVPRFELLFHESEQKFSDWELVPFCACAWYPHYIPCPSCPSDVDNLTVTDTGSWTITVSQSGTHELGIILRAHIFAAMGYNYQLTQSEQQSLNATHTETTQITRNRTRIMCFDRYLRQTWMKHVQKERLVYDWTYHWREWCGNNFTNQTTTTECTALIADGTVTWNTFPMYQYAPGKPPCGGVPISEPDPWDGVRETPCCPDVCTPPPSPATPCCGCEAAH